jgi:hypothetical protein
MNWEKTLDEINMNDFLFFLLTLLYVLIPIFPHSITKLWLIPIKPQFEVGPRRLGGDQESNADEEPWRRLFRGKRQKYMCTIKSYWWFLWTLTLLAVFIGWNCYNLQFHGAQAMLVNVIVSVYLFFFKLMPTLLEYDTTIGCYSKLGVVSVAINISFSLCVWVLLAQKRAYVFFFLWMFMVIALLCLVYLIVKFNTLYKKTIAYINATAMTRASIRVNLHQNRSNSGASKVPTSLPSPLDTLKAKNQHASDRPGGGSSMMNILPNFGTSTTNDHDYFDDEDDFFK